MFKRDDHVRTKPNAVFSTWQGFARSMLLPKPFTETVELRRTVADYSLISRDLGPKILIGVKDMEDFRKGKDFGGRYRGLGDMKASKVDAEDNIRTRLRSYGRSVPYQDLLKELGENQSRSQTKPGVSQKDIGNRTKDKKHDFAAEENNNVLPSIHRLSRSRPRSVLERHDDVEIVDGSDSASVCGVFLEDGTTCMTAPVIGRKRCTAHKGKRISSVPSFDKSQCEVPTGREKEEAEDICGVILPDMVRCRTKPVSRRKRCEEHKGMRVNAFFFLLNPTERDQVLKEDKAKPETRTSTMNQDESGRGLVCEATTKNGLPCTRSAPNGSRRCWQHKDENLDHSSSENVQSATGSQVICGVKLYNGSVCEKPPVKGRKRCEEHKGMRIVP